MNIKVHTENPSESHTGSTGINISVLVVAHREAFLVHRTLKSVYASVEFAEREGLGCEIIVVLDRGDDATRKCIRDFPGGRHHVVEADVGDLALAREVGRAVAKGEYISLIDGDDLYGREWLLHAYNFAKANRGEKIILHAENQVFFEAESFSVTYYPSHGAKNRNFNELCLASANHWTSILFFQKDVFLDRPFTFISRDPQNPRNFGFGYEDWHWIAEQIAEGASICVVPGTCNFVRRKKNNSMLQAYTRIKALLPPTSLLYPPSVSLKTRKLREQREKLERPVAPSKNALADGVSLRSAWRKVWRPVKERFPQVRRQVKSFKMAVRRAYRKSPLVSNELNGFQNLIFDACKAIHDIEPSITPRGEFVDKRYDVGGTPRFLSFKYERMCESVVRRPTHVFLVPWLKRGGSDLEALNYINAVCNETVDNSVVVISTVDSDSPWASKLPANVPFVNFGKIFFDASYEDQKTMLATLLVQLGPAVIHNINSQIGYQIFREQGRALRNQSKLYASVFCEDVTMDGYVSGYAFGELIDCFEHLAGVFADNARIIKCLIDKFGFPQEKFHLHYQPVQMQESRERKKCEELRVLWAGRMDRQKRTDILFEIVKRLEGKGVRFSIYGERVLETSKSNLDWGRFSHVTFKGPYDGFDSLPHEEFDVLLHTAQWEGLPNVLLEAIVRGLPVVASGVGGVPELTQGQMAGVAVSPFDDVDQYCEKLLELRDDRTKLSDLATRALALVSQRHSWESFRSELLQIPEYYTPSKTEADATRKIRVFSAA